MMASKNIKSIANGKILAIPSKDMLIGYFILTDMDDREKPKMFGTFEGALKAYQRGDIDVNEKIIAKGKGKVWETSVGRIILNNVFPEDYPFVNKRVGGAEISEILEDLNAKYPTEYVVGILDVLKEVGFNYATELGFTFAMEDCHIEYDVKSEINGTEEKDTQLQENYLQGLITQEEKVKLSVNMWNDFADSIAEEVWDTLDENNPVYEMVTSKANGGKIQARQILTVTGMVRDSAGNWIPMPIKGNFRDGLTAFEYFVAANGGRKGQADQSLRTPFSGYLTRRLVDVAHSAIIRQEDCGYEGEGIPLRKSDDRRLDFVSRIRGRVLAQDLADEKGKLLLEKDEVISFDKAKEIDEKGIEEIHVRTPLLCEAPLGLCKNCYGHDIEKGELVEMGKAVGVIAAQSIGEPGTQLTMRTFHKGGVEKTDITQGLPRVEELLEARTPKSEAQITTLEGTAKVEKAEDGSTTIFVVGQKDLEKTFVVSEAKKIVVEDGAKVKMGDLLFIDALEKEKQAPFDGNVSIDHGILTIAGTVKAEETINILPGVDVLIGDGEKVKPGQVVTPGAIDPKKLADVAGITPAQEYVIDEVQRVFNEQGVSLADIHFEIIVRQMARLGRVMDSGNSDYLIGSFVNRYTAGVKNELLREYGLNIAWVVPRLFGIKKSALNTESFLSAMSFQEHVRVLTRVAMQGKLDYLRGMKENVMIGKLIPAGERAEIEHPYELEEVKIEDNLEPVE
jgi:DNA-directed RNA polymerase subunit beta'